MSKFLLILLIVVIGFFAGNLQTIFAQPEKRPEFRIDDVYLSKYLPPHPAYFLKTARDNFKLLFTFNKVEKAQFHLDLANKRILETVGVIQRGRFLEVNGLLKSYQKNWKSFFEIMGKLKIDEYDQPAQKARRDFAKQKEILIYLAKNSPIEISQKLSKTQTVQEEKFNQFFDKLQGIDQIEKFRKDLE